MKSNTNYKFKLPVVSMKNKAKIIPQKQKQHQIFVSILRDRLFYLSHPSVSDLECSINLSMVTCSTEEFERIIQDVLSLANFNHKQIKCNYKLLSIVFKDIAAIKILNILLKDYSDHPLYPIYFKWVKGSEWMTHFT